MIDEITVVEKAATKFVGRTASFHGDKTASFQAHDQYREFAFEHFSPDEIYISGGSFKDSWKRTILNNLVLQGREYRQVTQADLALYGGFSSEANPWERKPPFGDIASTIGMSVYEKAFFITKEGYIGLGPQDLQVDNEVFVILGSRVPLILRQEKENQKYEPQGFSLCTVCHSLIGRCYVHGIMDGEVMDQPGRELQQIVLC